MCLACLCSRLSSSPVFFFAAFHFVRSEFFVVEYGTQTRIRIIERHEFANMSVLSDIVFKTCLQDCIVHAMKRIFHLPPKKDTSSFDEWPGDMRCVRDVREIIRMVCQMEHT